MKRKKLMIALVSMTALLLALVVFPFGSYDLSQVHSDLRGLREPYQTVQAGYYLDGGSVGAVIIDADDREVRVAFPVGTSPSGQRTYDRVFIGVMHASESNAVEVPFTLDTRHHSSI
jgi:hypothetical protein